MRIATYNIRNTQDQYLKRRETLKTIIQGLNADVISLQEVALPELDYLAEDYQKFFAPIQLQFPLHPDPEFRIDGNAILVRKGIEVKIHEFVHISVFRNIQHIVIGDVHIYNTHLHHVIGDDQVRSHQIDNIFTYLLSQMNERIFLMGDFNLTPESQEYKKMNQHFKSTYVLANQKEPEITFPTGLTGPFMDTDPAGTFDYIWIRGNNIQVQECLLFGSDKIAEGVYPSDHLGILGVYKI
ncbi:unnamed protein product [Paramecium sonneborni]|uniref:Endonuclease/exonuclease/phosphatase domain-containing protein n=1 Tax=Paramecium sonneborni TaxID=65129 RepID=A0A8S1P9C5_9CILI|nr:unnamed protein product [Paramecium sonneborni]